MPTLNWIGKEAVINHHLEVPFHLLKDVPDLGCGDPGAGNLIVEGDNLVALKALLPYYKGRVKCICIDPPYNTGNEGWAYNDNVNSPAIRKWLGETVGKEGETLDRHDRWLCMMAPRLALLREFLSREGVILVHIDDYEIQNLRALMDEIFGTKNFVAQFVWQTDGHTDNQFHVKVNHEYVVMYARHEDSVKLGYVVDPNTREESNLWKGIAENSITKNGPGNPPSEVTLPVGFPVSAAHLDLQASEIPDGLIEAMTSRKLTSNKLKAEFGRIQFPLRRDPMRCEGDKLTSPCRVFSGWANVNKLKQFIDGGCVPFPDDDGLLVHFYLTENGVIYYRKERGEQARHILSVLQGFTTTEKTSSQLKLMGLNFSYPKPVDLSQYLVRATTNPGDLVMDSFAGSGTTAHAVLKMNAANRDVSGSAGVPPAVPGVSPGTSNVENAPQRETSAHFSEDERQTTLDGLRETRSPAGGTPALPISPPASACEPAPRRFILVEMEPAIATGITRERVRRVAEGYTNAKGEAVPGLGGSFRYVRLGEAVFDEHGRIRESVRFAELARHVYFTETGEPLPRERVSAKSPLLGIHRGRAVHLLYNGILKDRSIGGGNALCRETLRAILALNAEHAGVEQTVVFGTSQRLAAARLKREGVIFRQIPYAIRHQ